jgi:hypothetical protein
MSSPFFFSGNQYVITAITAMLIAPPTNLAQSESAMIWGKIAMSTIHVNRDIAGVVFMSPIVTTDGAWPKQEPRQFSGGVHRFAALRLNRGHHFVVQLLDYFGSLAAIGERFRVIRSVLSKQTLRRYTSSGTLRLSHIGRQTYTELQSAGLDPFAGKRRSDSNGGRYERRTCTTDPEASFAGYNSGSGTSGESAAGGERE